MAHTFINQGFETLGAGPGLALGWLVAAFVTSEDIAAYDAVPEPWEDFEEGWNGNENYTWTLVAPVAAVYDPIPQTAEDFEDYWSNTPHLTDLDVTATALYGTTPYEWFEQDWNSNETGIFVFGGGDVSPASYFLMTPRDYEDFEEEWLNNQDDITTFTGLVAATFDGESAEDFEEVDLRMYTAEVTAVGADGDTLTVFVNGTPVTRNCTGVGTVDTERDFLVTGINAAFLGAVASPDGTGKVKLRATTSGDALGIKVEATGAVAKIILLPPPDKTTYWTQSGELAA